MFEVDVKNMTEEKDKKGRRNTVWVWCSDYIF